MELSTEWIEYRAGGEPVSAYRARPAETREPLPAVIVIQEVWGPDAHIQDVADRLAAAGYLALAPDLYSHGARPPELEPDRIARAKGFLEGLPPAAWMDPAKRAEALAELPPREGGPIGETLASLLPAERPMDRYLAVLRAAVAFLREDPAVDGHVASIGFCLGGGLSALLACEEPTLDAAVIFYGMSPAAERVDGVACPVLGFYGAEDRRITSGVAVLAAAMAEAGKDFEAVVYAGAPHAFLNDTRSSYRPAAARDAWARTLAFLARMAPARTVAPDAANA
ncbi:MAG: carboxymethylenebutenolidase [Solirubrobacteraceae bacterium]|jgi:carboxymethylenebutenolidase|nr:carboxymethylenebutenolidase [Solirubrobacteraceae bacterium]